MNDPNSTVDRKDDESSAGTSNPETSRVVQTSRSQRRAARRRNHQNLKSEKVAMLTNPQPESAGLRRVGGNAMMLDPSAELAADNNERVGDGIIGGTVVTAARRQVSLDPRDAHPAESNGSSLESQGQVLQERTHHESSSSILESQGEINGLNCTVNRKDYDQSSAGISNPEPGVVETSRSQRRGRTRNQNPKSEKLAMLTNSQLESGETRREGGNVMLDPSAELAAASSRRVGDGIIGGTAVVLTAARRQVSLDPANNDSKNRISARSQSTNRSSVEISQQQTSMPEATPGAYYRPGRAFGAPLRRITSWRSWRSSSDVNQQPGAYYGQGHAGADLEGIMPPLACSLEFNVSQELVDTVLEGYIQQKQIRNDSVMEASVIGRGDDAAATNSSQCRILLSVMAGLAVLVAVAVGVIIATSNDSASSSGAAPPPPMEKLHPVDPVEDTGSPVGEEELVDISSLALYDVVATVPETLCMDTYPGAGYSTICNANDTSSHGGSANNLVALAFHEYGPPVDIVLMNAGALASDIAQGEFLLHQTYLLLPFKAPMILMDLTGEEIISLVRYAVDKALYDEVGASGCAILGCFYPYTAGLRFDVNATAEVPDHVVTNFETLVEGGQQQWVDLDPRVTYSVLGYFAVLSLGARAYRDFLSVIRGVDDTEEEEVVVTETRYSPTDIFVQYAAQTGVLEEPSEGEYSTKSFIPK